MRRYLAFSALAGVAFSGFSSTSLEKPTNRSEDSVQHGTCATQTMKKEQLKRRCAPSDNDASQTFSGLIHSGCVLSRVSVHADGCCVITCAAAPPTCTNTCRVNTSSAASLRTSTCAASSLATLCIITCTETRRFQRETPQTPPPPSAPASTVSQRYESQYLGFSSSLERKEKGRVRPVAAGTLWGER